ncbi:MAG: chromosome segregation protein SMC [Gammaproteobacteria bacterium]|nr:chromosome segregation protein SMC [Gammaproteobacteria bacterium]
MRLSRIKLAGFKSFVDPTTFQLPSNLVGIVGPNGCGKSNVIDAVRWVMGEMSAKHLRGDSMADVIFNGSSTRKPVGTASIELFFDNSAGLVGGQYAQYAEIALKRTLSRDGTSSYFLNNTRCRRRDITEIFLGTGLGSRGYSIIEQGMVSRLVEAKPDDMRNYIEEAAGISKYKERRRETETRIQHTRDNMARLNDLREEIAKQIETLQRQARTAERYREHKARERRLEAELLGLKLAELDASLERSNMDLARQETAKEAAIADQRRIEAGIVSARERHVSATEAFNSAQARYYAGQSEISRLEQGTAHARETRDRQRADHTQGLQQIADIDAQIARDQSMLGDAGRSLGLLEPELARLRDAAAAASVRREQAEQALDDWQHAWQEFNLGLKELQQAGALERTRIEHLAAQLGQLSRQQQALDADRGAIALIDFDGRSEAQRAVEHGLAVRSEELQSQIRDTDRELARSAESERALSDRFEQLTADLASRKGQIAALAAIEQTMLGADDEALTGWLTREGLAAKPRLARQLRVEEGWVLAVETVLGDFLHAVCVKGFAHHLGALPDSQVILVENTGLAAAPDPRSLLSRVAEPGRAYSLLANVLTADNLADAVRLQGSCKAHESVVTRDGVWLGPGWVRVNRGQRSTHGLLARAHELRDLERTATALQEQISAVDRERQGVRGRVEAAGRRRLALAAECNPVIRDHAEAIAVLDGLRAEKDRADARFSALDRDIGQVAGEMAGLRDALDSARKKADTADEAAGVEAARRPDLQRRQAELLATYEEARSSEDAERAKVTALDLEHERLRVTLESVSSGLARLTAQRSQLDERRVVLDSDIAAHEPALVELQRQLSLHLEDQLAVDRDLAARRGDLEEVESALRTHESDRAAAEKAVAAVREALESIRLQVREVEIRREGVLEAFAANGAVLDEVLRDMPPDAAVVPWQEALDDVRRKIERLGPINLAAIEQFSEQSERKKYLDAQNDDLIAALDTLEQAIRKIDRETRARFQETFENVNQGLKRIFPRLFAGGHAYLSLEGEDVLSAGVTVMARPPGKRNSHIHLLSGGEKALTAVALIFAIFELNPAPFCLLDEVDAPLDEANVGRFCDIVREMAQRVQFVVITHNKTTMEMVNQLTGVTMNEPGVSRLVSVDLDAAVQLAAS